MQRDSRYVCSEERAREDTARGQPSAREGQASGETKPANILIVDYQTPELSVV